MYLHILMYMYMDMTSHEICFYLYSLLLKDVEKSLKPEIIKNSHTTCTCPDVRVHDMTCT